MEGISDAPDNEESRLCQIAQVTRLASTPWQDWCDVLAVQLDRKDPRRPGRNQDPLELNAAH
jgi:hypothetical protein